MRIREQTADRLIIEDRPWFLGLLLIFFILVALAATARVLADGNWLLAPLILSGAALALYALTRSVERVWLILDRPTGTAEIRRRNFTRFRTESFPLTALRATRIERDRDQDGSSECWRLALEIEGQDRPVALTSYYSGNRKPIDAAARAIEAFLTEPGQAGT